MLEQVLSLFDLNVDCDFHVMTQNQTLAGMTEAILHCSTEVFLKDRPDLVLVQGDTTSVAAVALAAFYLKIPVGHVEAGLRTGKKYSPFPEEMNRRIATCISELHFAPTRWSAENLRREGIEGKNIYIVGNPVIDTLQIAVKKNQQSSIYIKELPADLQPGTSGRRLCLITGIAVKIWVTALRKFAWRSKCLRKSTLNALLFTRFILIRQYGRLFLLDLEMGNLLIFS